MWHAVLTILECDWRFTIREIQDLLVDEHSNEISYMTGQRILAAEGYTKECARWVSKQLTDANKQVWVNAT